MRRVLVAVGLLALVIVGVLVGSRSFGPGTPDRKTLYVGLDDGMLLLVDPTSGVRYGEMRSRRASWILPLGPAEVLLVGTSPTGGAITKVDGTNTLARLDTRVVARLTGRVTLGQPIAYLTPGNEVAYLAQWDSSPAAARLLVGVAGEAKPREVLIGVTSPGTDRPLRGLAAVQSSLASAPDGALHACTGNTDLAARFVVVDGVRQVGVECGQFARVGERMYLAVRGKPRVALIDPGGRAVRDLPLPGIPVLVAGSI